MWAYYAIEEHLIDAEAKASHGCHFSSDRPQKSGEKVVDSDP
jgi:hypothetical protein